MNVDDKILLKAFKFALKSHASQTRKGTGAPYIVHPITVLSYLYETKVSKNMNLLATCALLHDVVEDCNVTLKQIAKKFGHSVAAIVEELTNDPTMIETIGKTEYLKEKMLNMSNYALVIKLCDRLHNIIDRTVYDEYIESTSEIIHHLVDNRQLTDTHKTLVKKISSVIYDIHKTKKK